MDERMDEQKNCKRKSRQSAFFLKRGAKVNIRPIHPETQVLILE